MNDVQKSETYLHFRPFRKDGRLLARGGVTVCYLPRSDGKVVFGLAVCSILDIYCKRTGRRLAKAVAVGGKEMPGVGSKTPEAASFLPMGLVLKVGEQEATQAWETQAIEWTRHLARRAPAGCADTYVWMQTRGNELEAQVPVGKERLHLLRDVELRLSGRKVKAV